MRRHDDKEYQVFPRERAKAFGASTGSLAALKPEGNLEGGVEALLKQHGLEEGKAVAGEELALSSLSPEEVLKRRAELRKMVGHTGLQPQARAGAIGRCLRQAGHRQVCHSHG